MDKPIYLGFALLELSKLLMYETYYDKLQPYFAEKNIQIHYMDTDSFVLSVNTKDFIKDLKTFEDFFDFSNFIRNREYFSFKKTKRLLVTSKQELLRRFGLMNLFVWEVKLFHLNVEKKKKLKKCYCKSRSKHNKFEEF